MEAKEEKSARYLAKLEKHIDNAKEAEKYSSDRFDVLLISLSTGSLLFSIGFAQNIVKDLSKADTSALKVSWLLFTVALIANLLSQVSSYYTHKMDIRVTNHLIRVNRGKESKVDQKRTEWWCKALNTSTLSFNLISLLTLIGGIVAFVYFANTNV